MVVAVAPQAPSPHSTCTWSGWGTTWRQMYGSRWALGRGMMGIGIGLRANVAMYRHSWVSWNTREYGKNEAAKRK